MIYAMFFEIDNIILLFQSKYSIIPFSVLYNVFILNFIWKNTLFLVLTIRYSVIFQVGRSILANSAESNLKRVSLELGGKSPLVIFDDANRK